MAGSTINCKSCRDAVTGNYCSNCGQPQHLKRVDSHYIIHEVQHTLHLEKGFFYTVKELLLHPGKTVRDFITDDRSRLVKPILFIIITSLIYTTIVHFFHVEDEYVQYSAGKASSTDAIFKWVEGHYGYANILMGIFIALWVQLFFKKYNFNFFEILILLCFIMGMGMLLAAFFALAEALTHIKMMQVSGTLLIGYCAWAIAQFFDKRKVANYFKAFFAYLLGMLTFTGIAILIGFAVDAILKH